MARSAAAVTTAAPGIETDPGSFQLIPIAKLVESPSNHRRKSWGDLDELAASIKAKGVLVPICVRPSPAGVVEGAFEIVYGHRRFRAATQAGLAEMPALVRHLSDLEVVEAQVIENLQRADVHPLEEAEGYEQLLASKERPYTVDDIAAKVGKSTRYVYARMQLLKLCAEGRKAFYEGRLTASVALLFARIPDEALQKKALKEVGHTDRDGEPVAFRWASEQLQRAFMLALKEAPFARDDAQLVAGAGACMACPKRTGAQPHLFEDVQGADVCTDPACYRQKVEAAWSKRSADAKAAGRRVLSESETKSSFYNPGYGGRCTLNYNSDFVELGSECSADPKYRTYKALLGKGAAEAIVLARDPAGNIRELVPKKDVPKLLKAAGHDFKAARSASPYSSPRASKEERAKQKAEDALRRAVNARRREVILAALAKREPDDTLWRLVALANEDAACEALDDVGHTQKVDLKKELAAKKGAELRAFALALTLDRLFRPYVWGAEKKAQADFYAWAKVDEKAIRAEVKAEQKEAAKAPAAPAKPAKRRGRR